MEILPAGSVPWVMLLIVVLSKMRLPNPVTVTSPDSPLEPNVKVYVVSRPPKGLVLKGFSILTFLPVLI